MSLLNQPIDAHFWSQRWQQGQTGWDLGAVSPPLKAYFDGLTDKSMSILIPGCGNAYEAEYLHNLGFSNVHVIDIAPEAVENFKMRVPSFPLMHIHLGDLFAHNQRYDLIIEQTFFCALDPALRNTYARYMPKLLKPAGQLVGLLFNIPLNATHPPFGGNIAEYTELLAPHFEIEKMERCHNSVAPRMGNELWIKLKPKN